MSNVAWLTEVKHFLFKITKLLFCMILVLVDHNNLFPCLHVKNLMDHNSEKYHYIFFITFNINALN